MSDIQHTGNLFESGLNDNSNSPVECLGIKFLNDEERRKYFKEKLREKLKDPEFRKIEGFPIGADEDILALSNPPYYTACPNPFITDFIKYYGKLFDPNKPYRREPFAADVSEGKNDPIYNAHSYHTKVPHKAIMRYILHYTDPGDIVFDGFCGTGMTGVAAYYCGNSNAIRSIGLQVKEDGVILDEKQIPISKIGNRFSIVKDLSPSATFISYNYNIPIETSNFAQIAGKILEELHAELGFLYETSNELKQKGEIIYTIWSEEHLCPNCNAPSTYWALITDEEGNHSSNMKCPHCKAELSSRSPTRVYETVYDPVLCSSIRQLKWRPVLINYKIGTKRFTKEPDSQDMEPNLEVIKRLSNTIIPIVKLPHGDRWRRDALDAKGISHVHNFYTYKNLLIIGRLREIINSYTVDERMANYLLAWFTSTHSRLHRMNRYIPRHRRHVGPMSGTLYVSPLWVEISPFYFCEIKRKAHAEAGVPKGYHTIVSTGSAEEILIPDNSVDYIFTDPPFGFNIQYSELNLLWEAWLKVRTNESPEAVINEPQKKGLREYQLLIERCFAEAYRILKPGRWATVEFHNSQNAVWIAIQEAMQAVGFVVSDVRVLDKQKGTTKQLSMATTVKQDLIITAYKPNSGFEDSFKLTAGTEQGAWDFVRTHLKQLPVFVSQDGIAEVIVERQNYLLFDRMVAFHVQRGVTVPLSAAEFYAGLTQRFSEREGMYFLPDQVAEYDKKRMTVGEVLQLQLYVTDESSAIQWLKQQLTKKPQTFQEIQPQFMRETKGGWQKHEKPLELSEMLEQNFLCYNGKGEVPSQIHSYLSTNFKEQRNLPKDDPILRLKAKDRWYVPDPNKAGDLEKLRERALLREFEEYIDSKQKRLKVFRLEAIRAGFKKAWQEYDYATIIAVARKLPENVLQEDPKLLMWYDQALTRMGEDI